MKLEDFLKKRHFEPLRVARLRTITENGLELELEPLEGECQQALVARLSGIVDSDLQVNGLSFEVEHEDELAVSTTDALLWDYGRSASVFGDAPLPEPARFFAEFTDMVRNLGVRRRDPVLDYLGTGYGAWHRRVGSNSYRLLTAPIPIVERATTLLDAQGARYRVLPNNDSSARSFCVVDVGHNWFVCEDAEVVRDSGIEPSRASKTDEARNAGQ